MEGRLLGRAHKVQLAKGQSLLEIGDEVNHAYFLTAGVVSLLGLTADGDNGELATDPRTGCRHRLAPRRRARVLGQTCRHCAGQDHQPSHDLWSRSSRVFAEHLAAICGDAEQRDQRRDGTARLIRRLGDSFRRRARV